MRYLTLCFLAVLSGCVGENSAVVFRAEKLIDPTEMPLVANQLIVDGIEYWSASDEARLQAVVDTGIVEILTAGFYPHALSSPGAAGAVGELWVLGITTSGALELRAFTDTNGDDVVDASSAETLFTASPGTEDFGPIRAVAFDEVSGTFFFFDGVRGDIYRAIDTTGNKRPDAMGAAPFAAGTWHPDHASAQYLTVINETTGLPELIPGGITLAASHLVDPKLSQVYVLATESSEVGLFVDETGDGVADSVTLLRPTTVVDPRIVNAELVDGMKVLRLTGTPGAALEVREVDAQGATVSVLGSVVATEGAGTVEIATALSAGDRIQVADTSNATDSAVYITSTAAIHIDPPLGPITFDSEKSKEITFKGANLNLVMDVTLKLLDSAQSQVLEFETSMDNRSITVTIPILGDGWDGYGLLVFGDGEDEEPEEEEDEEVPVSVCKDKEKEAAGGGG